MKEVIRSFGTWDYVVFALLFVISASIGLFFAFRNRKKSNDAQEYLMGGRHMHAVPVAFSLTAGFLSAITVLGTPSEFYVYGTMFTYYCFVYVIVGIVASEIYIPLFYNLGITSTYEYLELRFNKYVRVAGTTIYIINQVLYIGIVIYAPQRQASRNQASSLQVSPLHFSTTLSSVGCQSRPESFYGAGSNTTRQRFLAWFLCQH